MYTKKYLLFTLVPLLTFTAFGQQSTDATLNSIPVVKPGATLVKLPQQFAFAEGPAVDKKGDIYFTDQPNDKIWKYDVNGKLSLFMNKTGRANGLYFDKQQRIVACADEQNELRAITLKKKVTVLLDNFEGQKLNGPNDLWVDSKGGIYFTDPYYQRDYWQRKKPDMKGCYVYYLPKGSRKAVILDSTLIQPNGIVGKADGKTLYVADINDNKTWRYQINADGSLSNRQLFAAQGSDGMTIDRQGNIYLAGVGVTVYNAQGVKLGNIPVPSKWVGNLCFGGQRRDLLLITASESVYTLQMAVKGEG